VTHGGTRVGMFGQQRTGVLPGFSPLDLEPVFWVDAALSSVSGGKLTNLGTGGSALDAQFGSTTGVDTNDPTVLSHTGVNYLYLPDGLVNYASVPDEAVFSPTTSISYRTAVALDDWTPASARNLLGHYEGGTSNRSSLLSLNAAGTLAMLLSSDGVAATQINSTASPAVSDGGLLAIRSDWSSTPSVTFYTKATTPQTVYADVTSDTGWTQLGSVVTASVPATIFAATAPLYMAGYSSSVAGGGFYASAVKVDGTLRAAVDFTRLSTGAETSFTATTGQTVTINRATSGRKAAVVVRPTILLGADDYFVTADSDLLDFTNSESFTVIAVGRIFGSGTATTLVSKREASGGAWWSVYRDTTGTRKVIARINDGTNNAQSVSTSTPADGDLVIAGLVRNVTADTVSSVALGGVIEAASTDTTTGTLANTAGLYIGQNGITGPSFYDGEVVAVAVFRRALTAAEMAALDTYYGTA
jgi:hypothetical protein